MRLNKTGMTLPFTSATLPAHFHSVQEKNTTSCMLYFGLFSWCVYAKKLGKNIQERGTSAWVEENARNEEIPYA